MNLKKLKKTLNKNIETVLQKLGIEYEAFSDNIYSVCPCHEHSDNPRAFSYSIDKGIWKCWTRDCQNEFNNDIFGLIKGALSQKTGTDLEFKDVLKWVCEEFKIDKGSYEGSSTPIEQEDDFTNLIKSISIKSNTNFNDKEINNPYSVQYPSDYFLSRGFKKTTLKYFNVGDCHDTGIMKERSIIPIHDDSGYKLVGMIGRTMKAYRMPKFLIYPSGFNKRHYFYNYHRAIDKIKETNCLYIVEGQGDVWKLHEAGVKNAVSIFGKSISKDQENKIKKLPITRLVILMDNDQAGREARVQIQRQFGRMYRLTFPHLSDKDVGDMSVYKIKKDILSNLKGTY